MDIVPAVAVPANYADVMMIASVLVVLAFVVFFCLALFRAMSRAEDKRFTKQHNDFHQAFAQSYRSAAREHAERRKQEGLPKEPRHLWVDPTIYDDDWVVFRGKRKGKELRGVAVGVSERALLMVKIDGKGQKVPIGPDQIIRVEPSRQSTLRS